VLFAKAAGGLEFRHLPTTGGGPAIQAVLGNNAHFFVSPTSVSLTHIRSGKVRPLVLFGGKRSKSLPEVPTLKELGYDVEYYLWVGLFAPKGAPNGVVSTLRNGFSKAARSEAFTGALSKLGLELEYLDQPEFAQFWDADAKRIEDAVRLIGRVEG
jgi:tripartite-type tricarboxylate transporter receptor subunit TctC